jgi:hypothetical protein
VTTNGSRGQPELLGDGHSCRWPVFEQAAGHSLTRRGVIDAPDRFDGPVGGRSNRRSRNRFHNIIVS